MPENIRKLYKCYKKKQSYLIKDCDTIALILSVNEINGASEDIIKTQKIYTLFDNIFQLDKRDSQKRINNIKSIILNYL